MSHDPTCSQFALLRRFRELFEGKPYRHRVSNLGDLVACELYEDLVNIDRSQKFVARVESKDRVINLRNKATGREESRRGDGTFGERVPNVPAVVEPGYRVARAAVATIEIGTETKILAKAMIKQIDRVINDLVGQVTQFKAVGGTAISVALVGINHAARYTSYENEREWPTDGRAHKHPEQEAAKAESRLLSRARPAFDEFQVLRFRAENTPPFAFEWVDLSRTATEYAALLVRVLREYERRF